jgi:hypothetical protein
MKKEIEEIIVWSIEEQAFRRGYSHGFSHACSRLEITMKDIREWIQSDTPSTPPGSPFYAEFPHLINQNMYDINRVMRALFNYMTALDKNKFKEFFKKWESFCEINNLDLDLPSIPEAFKNASLKDIFDEEINVE